MRVNGTIAPSNFKIDHPLNLLKYEKKRYQGGGSGLEGAISFCVVILLGLI